MDRYYDRVFEHGFRSGRGESASAQGLDASRWLPLLDRLGIHPKTVLDVACGDGSRIRSLAARVPAEYTLLDISEKAVEYVRSHPCDGFVDARVADAGHLPFDDQSFDLAVLCHVLEHVSQPWYALVEAMRVARLVLVEIPLQNALLSNLAAWAREKRTGMPRSIGPVGHLHFFSDRTFRTAMTRWGMIRFVDSSRYIPPSSSRFRNALAALGPAAYGRFLQTHMVYLVEATSR